LWKEYRRLDADPTSKLHYEPSKDEIKKWLAERVREFDSRSQCYLSLGWDSSWSHIHIHKTEDWLFDIYQLLLEMDINKKLLLISSDRQRLLCVMNTESGMLAFNEPVSWVLKRIDERKRVQRICSAIYQDKPTDGVQLIAFCGGGGYCISQRPIYIWKNLDEWTLRFVSTLDVFSPDEKIAQWLNRMYAQFVNLRTQVESEWVITSPVSDDYFKVAFPTFETLPWLDIGLPKGSNGLGKWLPYLWHTTQVRGLMLLGLEELVLMKISQKNLLLSAEIFLRKDVCKNEDQ
jgi:hypothetical protein